MGKFKFLKVAEFDGVGGPAKEVMGDDKHMKTPTRSGRFVVAKIEKHISYGKYAFYSGIAWVTPLREYNKKAQIKRNGVWIDLSTVPAFSKYAEKDVLRVLIESHASLMHDPLLKVLPGSWIYNDFGHISVKYFKDLDGNYRLNGKEEILGDFIHTTPGDELRSSRGQKVVLGESHGCIHVKPKDIDAMLSVYIKRGSIIEVKEYTELTRPPISMELNYGRPEYETHFYPGLRKIFIYKVDAL